MRIMIFLTLIGSIGLCGCQTIVSSSHSDMVVKKGQTVKAYDNRTGILNLTTPDLTVSETLAGKCPGGIITGVESILRKRDFLIVQFYDLDVTGSCQNPAVVTK